MGRLVTRDSGQFDANERAMMDTLVTYNKAFLLKCVQLAEDNKELQEVMKTHSEKLNEQFRRVYESGHQSFVQSDPSFPKMLEAIAEFSGLVNKEEGKKYFQQAVHANDGLVTMSERSVVAQKRVGVFVTEMAGLTNGTALAGAKAKSPYRILEKALKVITYTDTLPENVSESITKPWPASKWTDTSRGALKYEDCDGTIRGIKALMEKVSDGTITIIKVKDRHSNPTGGGWCDVVFVFVFNDGEGANFPCEIQVVFKQLMVLRGKDLGGHGAYDAFRASDETLTRVKKFDCARELRVILPDWSDERRGEVGLSVFRWLEKAAKPDDKHLYDSMDKLHALTEISFSGSKRVTELPPTEGFGEMLPNLVKINLSKCQQLKGKF